MLQGVAGACVRRRRRGARHRRLAVVRWLDRIGELAVQLESRRADIASASTLATGHGLPILVAVAAGLVLAPLALYLTLADD